MSRWIPLALSGCIFIILVLVSCKKDTPENPYEGLTGVVQNENPEPENYPEGSFAWLHAKVFSPTCANSGCHDGTFEPEFRTLSSAYNSLVNHPVIANDENFSFEYRVVPGNSDASFLHERLTVDIPNTSGMMPLEVDSESDWESNSDLYIQKIATWINEGAPDMFGNPAPGNGSNLPPLVYGLAIFPPGNVTTPYPRDPDSPFGIGAIMVPQGPVDIWILPYDDNASVNGFESVTLKADLTPTNFINPIEALASLQSPITALDFGNAPNSFYYRATMNFSGATSGDTYYLRCYLDDGVQQSLTEIPNDGSNYFYYLLFSIKVL